MQELILQNAESMKQFEYLEKSLVTFQSAVSAQTSELRQVLCTCVCLCAHLTQSLSSFLSPL